MRTCSVLLWVGACSAAILAQAPSFDVASVKVNRSGAISARIAAPRNTGRLDVTNAMVWTLILNAYGLQDFQLAGAPAWTRDARFDIAARTHSSATRDDISAMLRSLLADRFGLVTHRETREMPTYALVLARADGRLGPQLKASTTDCPAAAAPGLGCGSTMRPGFLEAGSMTMDRLATTMGGVLGRIVKNETGLAGAYDLQLTFTPEPGVTPPTPVGLAVPPSDPDAPSVVAALTEQLGLKLEPRRSPVDMLVIDRVEMPTED